MLSGTGEVRSRWSPRSRAGPDATAAPVYSARGRAGCQGAWPEPRGVAQGGGVSSPLSPGRRDAADVPRAPIGGRGERGVARHAVSI